MSQHEIPDVVRAFIAGGVISHLVRTAPTDRATRDSICGSSPWPGAWTTHVDAAKALPLCVDCLHAATRPARKRKR